MKKFLRDLLHGDRHAAARLISLMENDAAMRAAMLREIRLHGEKAFLVGVTGAPGSGKSTIIAGLTALLRKKKKQVGIIAVDPTSPLTGGALLGDRIRMHDLFRDPGVFIRSMAMRDGRGGLAPAAAGAARVLGALGMDTVFIETTGAGQGETAVRDAVDRVIVIVTPDSGDQMQMMKAGLMEIGDIIVVNKSDLPQAEGIVEDLEKTLGLLPPGRRRPQVIPVVAREGKGLPRVLAALEELRR